MATYSGSDKRLQYLFQHGGGGSLEDLDDVEITNPSDGDALVYDGEEEKWVNGEGGGGNANEQVLTKAEYDALTEEQKMNNTTYYINDADTWTSKEVQPVIYSTEEREIGVWLDGKPLYQKTTVYNSTNTSGGQIEQDVSSLNIDTCVYLDGFCDRSGTGYGPLWYRFNCYENDNYFAFLRYDDYGNNHNIVYKIKFGTGENTSKQVITIRYTKTTDQAGSGIYTPQGQLAVHYSTDEHVIGTWIDGKPLYEKTLHPTSIGSGDNSIAHGITNADKLISASGSAYSGTLKWLNIPTASTSLQFMLNLYGFDSTIIHFEVGNGYSSSTGLTDAYITLRYTKTTS